MMMAKDTSHVCKAGFAEAGAEPVTNGAVLGDLGLLLACMYGHVTACNCKVAAIQTGTASGSGKQGIISVLCA
jgi:hypothetical protein